MTTIKQFISNHKIRMTAQWADDNPNMADMPAGSSHYRCTFRAGGKSFTTYFSQGPAHTKEPTAADVLDCIASDCSGAGGTFEDFCSEYGYDEDSRKAERTYKAVRSIRKRAEHFLGEAALHRLMYDTERL